MPKCGYIVHKTMPEFLSRQCEMDLSQQGAALSAAPLPSIAENIHLLQAIDFTTQRELLVHKGLGLLKA
jgi:hypothetical protein